MIRILSSNIPISVSTNQSDPDAVSPQIMSTFDLLHGRACVEPLKVKALFGGRNSHSWLQLQVTTSLNATKIKTASSFFTAAGNSPWVNFSESLPTHLTHSGLLRCMRDVICLGAPLLTRGSGLSNKNPPLRELKKFKLWNILQSSLPIFTFYNFYLSRTICAAHPWERF